MGLNATINSINLGEVDKADYWRRNEVPFITSDKLQKLPKASEIHKCVI